MMMTEIIMAGLTATSSSSSLPVVGNGFFQDVIFYFAVKIVTSLDDLVWLSPFMVISGDTRHNEKLKVAAIYTLVSLLILSAALLLSKLAIDGLTMVLNSNDGDDNSGSSNSGNMSRMLNFVGGTGIAILAFFEWKNNGDDNDDDGDDDGEQENGQNSPADVVADAYADADYERGRATENTQLLEDSWTDVVSENIADEMEISAYSVVIVRSERRRRSLLVDLFIIGICGQLDTLAVITSVIIGRAPEIRVAAVICGSLLATAVVLMCAYSITLFKPLTRCLKRVPLWSILCLIAVFVFLQGFLGI